MEGKASFWSRDKAKKEEMASRTGGGGGGGEVEAREEDIDCVSSSLALFSIFLWVSGTSSLLPSRVHPLQSRRKRPSVSQA